jgi:hypothetical protein
LIVIYGGQTLEEIETLTNVFQGRTHRSEEEMTKPLKHNIDLSKFMTNNAIRELPHLIVALLQCILLPPMIDTLNQLFHRLAAREVDESFVLALQI